MAIDKFIPEVWSARMTRILEPRLVLAQPRVMNRNWEGDIREKGDTVHIRNFTTGGTIRDYDGHGPLNAGNGPERPSDNEQVLTVDQGKEFYIAVDDIDEAQADLTIMDKFLTRTARNMAVALDTHAASRFVAGVAAANKLGDATTPITVKADGTGDFTPYELCVELGRLLEEQDVNEGDRWLTVNAAVKAEFLLDPQFIQGAGGIADASVVRQGRIGEINGFELLQTQALPGDAGAVTPYTNLVYGDGNYALTWADQVVKVEAERLQGEFSDALKGMHIFGSKIIETESFGVAYVAR